VDDEFCFHGRVNELGLWTDGEDDGTEWVGDAGFYGFTVFSVWILEFWGLLENQGVVDFPRGT
jgi:hypothetical protein